MELKIRWVGCSSEHDSYKPLSELLGGEEFAATSALALLYCVQYFKFPLKLGGLLHYTGDKPPELTVDADKADLYRLLG